MSVCLKNGCMSLNCMNYNLSLCLVIIEAISVSFRRSFGAHVIKFHDLKSQMFVFVIGASIELCCLHFTNLIYYESHHTSWMHTFITFPNNVLSLHDKETQALYFYGFVQSISNIC